MTEYSTQSKYGNSKGGDPRWWVIRKISDLSLRAKVSLFVVGAILLPLALVTFLLLELLGNASISVGQRTLSETSGLIQQQLLQSVDAKAQIYDLTFKGMLVDLRSLGRTFTDVGVREQNLSMFFYKHPFIDRVYVVDEQLGTHAIPDGVGGLGMSALAGTDAFMGRWVGPYEFNGKTFVSYLLPIQKATTTGFVAFDIAAHSFFYEIVRLDPSESSYLVMIRNSGEYLSSSDAIYEEWGIPKEEKHILHSGVAHQTTVFDALASMEKERGIFSLASTSEKVVAYASVPSFQGKLAVVSPLGELIAVEKEKAANIQHAVNTVGTQGIIYVLIIDSLIIWLTYFLFGRGVIRPIETLREGVATLRRTNFNAEIFITSQDEIGHLGRDFNDMAHKIRDSYDELEIETEKLQESTSFLQTLVKNMPVGVILVEAESHKILLMNRVGEEILGKRFDPTKPETFYEFANFVTEKGEHYPDELRPLYRAIRSGEVCRADDVVVVTPDGRKKNLSIISMPIRDSAGVVTSAVSVYTDITEARIVERSRNEFFAVASHELRTPLTAIRGNADMILEMYADQITDANLKQMLQDIETSSVRMIGVRSSCEATAKNSLRLRSTIRASVMSV
jgi:PAS domain S-box-containing protein